MSDPNFRELSDEPVSNTALSQTAEDAFVRRARIEDLPDIAKIHRLAFMEAMPRMPVRHTPMEDLNFYSTAVFPHSDIWLAELSDMVVGFIAFRPGWVDQLYVHPACQRRGLGTRLLGVAQIACPALRLWTFQCNPRARRFYEKSGFRSERETDGAGNEEKQPDILFYWERGSAAPGTPPSIPEP
ncbi:MAG TPA: GNAT family N-acetyltransferase [Chthoniobacter sp.]|jgi:ribosomal protein S18 acetylase RimI-like enzyme